MNRLIIIGNGFDLAHGLPTRYEDFITWMLKNALLQNKDETVFKVTRRQDVTMKPLREQINTINSIESFSKFTDQWYNYFNRQSCKNDFLNYALDNRYRLENWNDLEFFLFDRLKIELSKVHDQNRMDLNLEGIENLNRDFDQIKTYFEQYLIKVVQPLIPNNLERSNRFHSIFSGLPAKNHYPLDQQVSNVYILNFNYTNTIDLYLRSFSKYNVTKIINIHGELNNPDNPIIFGYGDELNKEYQDIQNVNRSEFLCHFKYLSYLRTSNYKEIDKAIKSDFETVIIGHSCGLSDRTLLNKILNRDECKNIRIYQYGQYEGYRSILDNISRHMESSKLLSLVEHYNPENECPSYNFR